MFYNLALVKDTKQLFQITVNDMLDLYDPSSNESSTTVNRPAVRKL